jgi:mono/diheme cytochrome c family protein
MKRLTIALLVIAGTVHAGVSLAQDQAKGQQRGKEVFQYWCTNCHGPGAGGFGAPHLPGTGALQAKYQGAIPALLEERTDMAPLFIKTFVRNGVSIMPFFRKTEVSDADLEALTAYLTRNNKK